MIDPEPAHTRLTRAAYDTVATDYADLLVEELNESPWERAVLAVFAETVLRDSPGPVLDLGCGPGRLTGHLKEIGLDVSGLDLSPGMVSEAQKRCPDLEFRVGTMAALDLADGSVAAVLAWYSIIHTPPAELPPIFTEIRRVLRPGGLLQLGFQVGDEKRSFERAYGHQVRFDAYRNDPDLIAGLLTSAGFELRARTVRAAERWEPTPQAYLLARRT